MTREPMHDEGDEVFDKATGRLVRIIEVLSNFAGFGIHGYMVTDEKYPEGILRYESSLRRYNESDSSRPQAAGGSTSL
jgi:hypothetical protein